MIENEIYKKVVKEYFRLNNKKEELIREQDKISARLNTINDIMSDLNVILCKHGCHIYEHFEEEDPQESEGE